MNPRIYILDHATGEETEREMTDAEVEALITNSQPTETTKE